MTIYDPASTALLLVDPYNDFLSPHGKLWPVIEDVATVTNSVANMRRIVAAAREVGVRVVFVPHHRWVPEDYVQWKFPTATQIRSARIGVFAKDSWGGTFHEDFPVRDGDVVVAEHWAQSGFANTDLDQQLRQRGIDHVISIGMLANTCIESTSRFAMELGYHVTIVTDATAAASVEAMTAAHKVNGPTFAHSILTTEEIVEALTALRGAPA